MYIRYCGLRLDVMGYLIFKLFFYYDQFLTSCGENNYFYYCDKLDVESLGSGREFHCYHGSLHVIDLARATGKVSPGCLGFHFIAVQCIEHCIPHCVLSFILTSLYNIIRINLLYYY